MKRLKGKSLICIVLICAVLCFVVVLSINRTPEQNAAALYTYIQNNADALIDLAKQYSNQYKRLNIHGIEALDTRSEDVCFIFSWSYNISEGGSYLYFADDDVLTIREYTFFDNTYIEGLGINGKGYIRCTKLAKNWYYIEEYLPT